MKHPIRSSFLGAAAGLSIFGLTSVPALAETSETFNKSYSVTSGGKLMVDVDFGSLEVTSGSGTEVKIHVERSVSASTKAKEEAFLEARPIEVTQDGSNISIRSRNKNRGNGSGWGWFGYRNQHARYTIEVPPEFNTKLHTSGGGITLRKIKGDNQANTSGGGLKFSQLEGNLDGHTSGGGVDVDQCKGTLKVHSSGGGIKIRKSAGSIDADTSGGSISVDGFDGPVDVNTSGGGLHLDDITGKLKGHTSGGGIKAKVLADKPEIDLHTSGGGITLAVNGAAAFHLDASTSAGSVSCDLPVTIQGKKKNDEIRGDVNGGGGTVKLHSSGGSIHVVK